MASEDGIDGSVIGGVSCPFRSHASRVRDLERGEGGEAAESSRAALATCQRA